MMSVLSASAVKRSLNVMAVVCCAVRPADVRSLRVQLARVERSAARHSKGPSREDGAPLYETTPIIQRQKLITSQITGTETVETKKEASLAQAISHNVSCVRAILYSGDTLRYLRRYRAHGHDGVDSQ